MQPRRPDVDTPTSTPAVVAVAGSASVASATGARLTGCGACSARSSARISSRISVRISSRNLERRPCASPAAAEGLEPTDGFTFARPACLMLPPLTTDPSTARDRGCAPSPCSRRLSRSWEGAVAHSSPFVAFTLATGPIPPAYLLTRSRAPGEGVRGFGALLLLPASALASLGSGRSDRMGDGRSVRAVRGDCTALAHSFCFSIQSLRCLRVSPRGGGAPRKME